MSDKQDTTRLTASGQPLPDMSDQSVIGYTEKRGGPSDRRSEARVSKKNGDDFHCGSCSAWLCSAKDAFGNGQRLLWVSRYFVPSVEGGIPIYKVKPSDRRYAQLGRGRLRLLRLIDGAVPKVECIKCGSVQTIHPSAANASIAEPQQGD